MRFVVVGAGAMGTVFGTALARAGHDVALLGRPPLAGTPPRPREVLLQSRDGSTASVIIAPGEDASIVADANAVIVLVKSGDTVAAMKRIAPYLRSETPILTLQNGLGASSRIRASLGDRARVLPAVTSQAAMRTEAGHVFHMGEGPTYIGYEGLGDAVVAARLAQEFTSAGLSATAVPDIERRIWRKAAINAAINGMTALGGFLNGAIVEDPELLEAAVNVAAETAMVARAHGIELGDLRNAIIDTATATAMNRSSMLQDLEAGRTTEVAAIHGAIREAGLKLGVSTPAIDMLAALISAMSNQSRTKEFAVV